ncbi:ABC transporter ATP-binding protein [Acetanaerobacterium elongatum]|uniref:ABC-2 type transport system ATP-binding protein n=1 Tax=Acetanaerobacterium elongatum TaxID=258515 RepID=A0A1H0C1E8_9FIRM|nr:ATP-binding cassette domain-containing protein [Acetanaerobacterium elongatum]SDN51650.1 ABC-2 type transport system ATP-binding protein [Acetanaerobacterium elongatum]
MNAITMQKGVTAQKTDIIQVKNLCRTFKVPKRSDSGLLSSIKALFHREYVTVNAVNDISFTVKKGEIRGLIGPNGAGKSTTIKIMSGILYPSSGEVDVMGYKPWLEREEYVKHIGVLFGQRSQLEWDLPPIDSFYLRKKLYDIPDEVYKRNIEYFKELLDIAEIINKPVRQLSLGERMKCEFVCSVLHEPPLVFLDEPTIGLDVVSKETVRGFISAINKEKNTTFILTTHDLSDIENLCENITVINNGTIVFDDGLAGLQEYFPKRKVVKVQFETPVDYHALEPFHPTSYNRMKAEFEVDLSECDVKTAVNRMFECLPVADINIESVSIEEVIRHIYTEQ